MDKSHTMSFFFLTFFVLLLVENVCTTSICDQTQYPDLCNSIAKVDNQPFNVRDASLRFTLIEAQKLHYLISTMKLSSFNHLTKSAFADCLELSQDTIDKLNLCIAHENVPSTKADVQTWLSAALANQETCKNGFIDFKLPFESLPFPFLLTNFSKQLSNSLAIIRGTPLSSSSLHTKSRNLLGRHGAHWTRVGDPSFPEWVSMADRRLLQTPSSSSNADMVIAKDGSGDFTTISEGLRASSSRKGTNRFVIYVKKGVYQENVVITKSMKNFMFIGDGIDSTIVTGSKNVQDGTTTFRSATFAVSGNGFIARGITFENTAGPQKHQAVALRSGSDFSVFYSCSFKGYQDTLYVYSQRQFYRDCDVHGTVDFIFGDGIVVFQNCNIYIRKPLDDQVNTVTAQSRKDANENTGIIIHNSRIIGSPDLGSTKSFLGRPWKQYSRTVIMRTLIDGCIDPTGWLPWDGDFALGTLYYGEYMNVGAGARTSGRVKWPGYHVITSPSEAEKFSVGEFLGGDSWIPGTRVPFTSGL